MQLVVGNRLQLVITHIFDVVCSSAPERDFWGYGRARSALPYPQFPLFPQIWVITKLQVASSQGSRRV
jgi:hypothetical protein